MLLSFHGAHGCHSFGLVVVWLLLLLDVRQARVPETSSPTQLLGHSKVPGRTESAGRERLCGYFGNAV